MGNPLLHPHTALTYAGNPGYVGLVTDYDGRVSKDYTNSGLGGEIIDLQRMPFSSRYAAMPARPPVHRDGVAYCIPIVGRTEPVLLKPGPFFSEDAVVPTRVDLTLRGVATSILIIIVSTALWRSPTRSNAVLFAFCVGANPVALNARPDQFPSAAAWLAEVMLIDLLFAIAIIDIVDFAIHRTPQAPFSRYWDATLWYIVPISCALTVWPDFAKIALGIPSELINRLGYLVDFALAGYGISAVLHSAITAARDVRSFATLAACVYTIGLGGYLVANVLMFTSLGPVLCDTANDALESLSFLLRFRRRR